MHSVTDDYFTPPQQPASAPQYGQRPPGWAPPAASFDPPPPSPEYNALAIVSLVLAVMGFAFIAAIVGHIARNQIRTRRERGDGLALAGIIVGWISTALYVLSCGFFGLLAIASGP
jgi:hypothetical protein